MYLYRYITIFDMEDDDFLLQHTFPMCNKVNRETNYNWNVVFKTERAVTGWLFGLPGWLVVVSDVIDDSYGDGSDDDDDDVDWLQQ